MRSVVLICSIFILSPLLLKGQEIITYHSGGINQTFDSFVHVFLKIDLASCESEELLVMETPVNVRPFGLADIGYAPDGFMYGIDGFDGLYKIDLDAGEIVDSWPLPPGIQYGGMSIDGDGLILLSGEDGRLVTFDIDTEEFTDLGMLDDSFPYRLTLAGIAQYRGRLFGSLVSGHLVEIFLEEMRAEYIMESMNVEQSLFIYEEECDQPIFITGTNRGTLRLLDPVQDTFYNKCQIDVGSSVFFGITSFTEYQSYQGCRDTIDLNSTTAGFDYFIEEACGIDRVSIAHDSARVYGDYPMDSIRVMLMEEPDPGAGVLETGAVGGIIALGAGTEELLASGMVDFVDWEAWLRQLEYVSSAGPPSAGLRRIAVVGYFNGGGTTDTAWVEIEVLQPDFSAGEGSEVEECPTGKVVDIFDYMSGADEGGRWVPEVAGGSLELLPSNSGTYLYIVDHPACGSDTATLELFIWPGPDLGIRQRGSLCDGQSTNLELTGDLSEAVSYLWSTGSAEPQIEVNEAGVYWVRMVYGEDCIWSDTIEVTLEEGVTIEEEADLCPGQSLEWRGQIIDEAGEYEEVAVGQSGDCDSVLVLRVSEREWISREAVVDICPGEVYEIMGEELTDPGQYEFVLNAEEGCDTLLSLELTWSDLIERDEMISICPGEIYEIMGEELTDPGQYEFIVPSESGCDTLLRITLEESKIPEAEILGPDRVCEGEEIALIAAPEDQLEQVFWSSGQTANEIKVTVGGWYSFEGFTAEECPVYAEKKIEDCPSRNIFIPNAFSPNGDGVNDEWQVYIASEVEMMELSIYDRWGSRVYVEKSTGISWDGKFRGEDLPVGVYVYHLEIEFDSESLVNYTGEVVLMR